MERVASSCVSLLAQRRAYSVAAAVAKGAGRRADEKKAAAAAAKRVMGKKEVNTAAAASAEKTAWVPDPVTGRGYSVAAAVVKGPGRKAVEKVAKRVMGKEVNTAAAASAEKTPWVPDPVTGYYRPAGGAKEVDAAELRAKLLTQRVAN
ncbi:hypothetical protein BAE44_0003179 [Dichanthelium oligosanthes]|uniref:Late embryogenesis abundant protein Lea5 n=1 Tax=Dichanthelium oligosanthes TaxID=888268 RepID=A0A1E5WEH2_9POAL|nr:hypothetical protein BAE44_0003179 [Dichanthelium oligosanthes]